MMYASKLKIDRTPKTVRKTVVKPLGYDHCLSIAFLREVGIGDNDEFSVYTDENSGQLILSYDIVRLETQDEVEKRVAKAVAYNKAYEEFHRKRDKK